MGNHLPDQPLLEIRDVSIQYGAVRTLDNLSFSVPREGLTAVIGPNGAGKTTLFNCVRVFTGARASPYLRAR